MDSWQELELGPPRAAVGRRPEMGSLGMSLGPGCLPGRQLSGGALPCAYWTSLQARPWPCLSVVTACGFKLQKARKTRVATEGSGTLCHAGVPAQAGDSISYHLAPFVKVKGRLAGMTERSQDPCGHQEHRPAVPTRS